MNNEVEDMIHIKDTLFNKFEREEIKAKKDVFTIDELLECVKMQTGNEENYKRIERDMIRVLLLDSITNNGDRHALNWALVRNEKTNEYTLGVFDHASSFIDMFYPKMVVKGIDWSSTYIIVGNDKGRNTMGSSGKAVVEYISKKYPEYYEEFYNDFNSKIDNILDLVKQENLNIDFKILESKIKVKQQFLKKLRYKEEMEYGD